MDDRTSLLQCVSIFGALRPETLEFLLARAVRVEVRENELLVREHDPGGDLYVLESGRAEVFKERCRPGEAPVRLCLAELRRGDCVGETSILAIMPRSASVRALCDLTALRLRNADLLALHKHDVEQFALFVMNLGRETARRLWLTNELLLERLLGG